MNTFSIRESVVDLCIEMSRRGYFSGTGGNIAVRIDADRFAVTPSATDYFAMTPDDICVLRLTDLERIEGERTPSVESSLHARMLRARPDIQCSIHTHQPVASACALLGKALEVPPGPLRDSLGRRVPVAGYAPSGSGWLSAKVGRQLRSDTQAYLMFNHGVLCCGRTTAAAVQTVENLETLARGYLKQLIESRAAREPVQQRSLRRIVSALSGHATF
ncbi:class II aldolase/adducin family protein [Burkholderia vietnamiensis]|uniref:class II aldolase/adducin family protein n=1 Tax=Burkholderia vietnamiensis TaxID=60552 RepID=UPI001B939B9C|nr:class II aldolase/adducin family protein [Burkholderia vietnamiensis]MBR8203366.1 class II aldolase/adducin family protein [Burkholderia vietnamiensis]